MVHTQYTNNPSGPIISKKANNLERSHPCHLRFTAQGTNFKSSSRCSLGFPEAAVGRSSAPKRIKKNIQNKKAKKSFLTSSPTNHRMGDSPYISETWFLRVVFFHHIFHLSISFEHPSEPVGSPSRGPKTQGLGGAVALTFEQQQRNIDIGRFSSPHVSKV